MVTPVVVDLKCHDETTVRRIVREGLSGPAPMFCLKNYGFEELITEVRANTRAAHKFEAEPQVTNEERCISCELEDERSLELKKKSKALVTSLCDTLFGPEFRARLEERGQTLDGRQSMRRCRRIDLAMHKSELRRHCGDSASDGGQ